MDGSNQRWILRIAGAGLLFATGAIHLDLYLTGYNTIPTIKWLFLLQVISAFALGALVLTGNRLMAAAGALFCLGTLGGYLLSIWFGLFGFREVRTTAGIVAGVIEVAGFAVLAALALLPAASRRAGAHRGAGAGAESQPVPHGGLLVAGVSVVALVLLGVAVAGAGSSPAATSTASGQVVKTAEINGQKVLVNSKGLTLYWFAPDKKNKSVCYGACASYWPLVPGHQKAGPGVNSALLGTISRTDGSTQATYNGRPLYTYIADSSPGQAHGNNVNLNGGLWHVVPVTG